MLVKKKRGIVVKKRVKGKKKRRLTKLGKILIVIILSILFAVVIMFVCNNFLKSKRGENIETVKNEVIELDNYNYFIHGNATKYEKKLSEELKKILSVDEVVYEDYASVITKLFLSDLFTLSNKNSSSDITSSQYVYTDYQDMYKLIVKDSIYSNIEINLGEERDQSLPTVTNVDISSVNRNVFSLNKVKIDEQAFYIRANISYEKDLGYPNVYEVVIVKNDNLLQIVKANEI
jgi:hypothetical protein